MDYESPSSQTKLYLNISKIAMARLDEISDIENIPKPLLMEKLIMSYDPIRPVRIGGQFKSIFMAEIRKVRKLKPYAIVINVAANYNDGASLCPLYNNWLAYNGGKLTWNEFTRLYIEKLQSPEAQAKIKELKKYCETEDIYVTCFTKDEEHSVRRLFVDYMNGKLIWK